MPAARRVPERSRAPAARAREAAERFAPGQYVEYHSESLGRWVEAIVERVNRDGTVDLDVRRGADRCFIRELARAPARAPAPAPALAPARARRAPARAAPVVKLTDTSGTDYSIGDRIQYSSDSKANWVPATVVALVGRGRMDLSVGRGRAAVTYTGVSTHKTRRLSQKEATLPLSPVPRGAALRRIETNGGTRYEPGNEVEHSPYSRSSPDERAPWERRTVTSVRAGQVYIDDGRRGEVAVDTHRLRHATEAEGERARRHEAERDAARHDRQREADAAELRRVQAMIATLRPGLEVLYPSRTHGRDVPAVVDAMHRTGSITIDRDDVGLHRIHREEVARISPRGPRRRGR